MNKKEIENKKEFWKTPLRLFIAFIIISGAYGAYRIYRIYSGNTNLYIPESEMMLFVVGMFFSGIMVIILALNLYNRIGEPWF